MTNLRAAFSLGLALVVIVAMDFEQLFRKKKEKNQREYLTQKIVVGSHMQCNLFNVHMKTDILLCATQNHFIVISKLHGYVWFKQNCSICKSWVATVCFSFSSCSCHAANCKWVWKVIPKEHGSKRKTCCFIRTLWRNICGQSRHSVIA